MMRYMLAAFIVCMLDAATTYIAITTDRGVEANPLLYFTNYMPEAAFLVQAVNVLLIAKIVKIFEKIAAVFPPVLRVHAYKSFYAASVAGIIYRAAVVANNVSVILFGVAPLADVLYA
jgi:hypothetical protein